MSFFDWFFGKSDSNVSPSQVYRGQSISPSQVYRGQSISPAQTPKPSTVQEEIDRFKEKGLK